MIEAVQGPRVVARRDSSEEAEDYIGAGDSNNISQEGPHWWRNKLRQREKEPLQASSRHLPGTQCGQAGKCCTQQAAC